jgi:hypothetical protein
VSKSRLFAGTPTSLVSWTLFFAGAAAAVVSRFVEDGDPWIGTALVLIGLSVVLDVVLPGGSKLNDEQTALVRVIGIRNPQRAHRIVALLLGVPLAAYGAYVLAS